MPDNIAFGVQRSHDLRYGENPHQAAAYYARGEAGTPLGADQLAGKQLSYNNILDVDAAWRAVSSFEEPTVVIAKHLNPTGIASAGTVAEAFARPWLRMPSSFGGLSRPMERWMRPSLKLWARYLWKRHCAVVYRSGSREDSVRPQELPLAADAAAL